jgi:hypothetical protein
MEPTDMLRPPIKASLIAPCGMNCTLCHAYLRDKNTCVGCRAVDTDKAAYCRKCIIKNCEHIAASESKLCYECNKFPCTRLKQLDKRYRTKYHMSMIENLEYIQQFGIDAFVEKEEKRWTCENCGSLICVHRVNCLNCGEPWAEQQ